MTRHKQPPLPLGGSHLIHFSKFKEIYFCIYHKSIKFIRCFFTNQSISASVTTFSRPPGWFSSWILLLNDHFHTLLPRLGWDTLIVKWSIASLEALYSSGLRWLNNLSFTSFGISASVQTWWQLMIAKGSLRWLNQKQLSVSNKRLLF